jgi:hypothetical protein
MEPFAAIVAATVIVTQKEQPTLSLQTHHHDYDHDHVNDDDNNEDVMTTTTTITTTTTTPQYDDKQSSSMIQVLCRMLELQPHFYDKLSQELQTNPQIRQHLIDSVVRSKTDLEPLQDPLMKKNVRALILEAIQKDVSLWSDLCAVDDCDAVVDDDLRAEYHETIELPLLTFQEDRNYTNLPDWAKQNIPFLVKAIQTSSSVSGRGIQIYQALPPDMKHHAKIRKVLTNYLVRPDSPFHEMPLDLCEDIALWEDLVECNLFLYTRLPPNLKQNEQIARAAVKDNGRRIWLQGEEEVFAFQLEVACYCPSMTHLVLNDMDPMSVNVELLQDVLQRIIISSSNLLDDEDLMLRLCEFSGTSMECASDRLKSCVSFIERLIENARDEEFMLFIPPDVLQSNPHLVHRYLGDGCIARGAYKPDILMDVLPKTMWTDRDIVIHYFRASGEYFPVLGRPIHDREICLSYIQGCPALSRRNLLPNWMHDDLKQSKEFVAEAAVFNPWVIYYASDAIKQDYYDILLVTVANHGISPLRHFQRLSARPDCGKLHIDTVAFANQIISKLDMHTAFVTAFLSGISSHHQTTSSSSLSVSSSSSPLTMLDFGTDHSIKMRIAMYAGVPTGLELTYLRRALPVANNVKQDPEGVAYFANVDPYVLAPSWNQASSHRVL